LQTASGAGGAAQAGDTQKEAANAAATATAAAAGPATPSAASETATARAASDMRAAAATSVSAPAATAAMATSTATAAVAATATAVPASRRNSCKASLAFFVEDVEGRQTHVCDFLLAEKDWPPVVLQHSVGWCSRGRAAGHGQGNAGRTQRQSGSSSVPLWTPLRLRHLNSPGQSPRSTAQTRLG
jgi:hypothetical protein